MGFRLGHERAARLLTRRCVGEDVAELRVGVLVHAAVGDDREVAPHLRGGARGVGSGRGGLGGGLGRGVGRGIGRPRRRRAVGNGSVLEGGGGGRRRRRRTAARGWLDRAAARRGGAARRAFWLDWKTMRSILPEVGLKPSSGFSAVMRAAMQWRGYFELGLK